MSTIELETHILSRVRMLPQTLRSQVADYIDFLLQRYDEQGEHLDVINRQSGLEATVLPTMSGQVQSYVINVDDLDSSEQEMSVEQMADLRGRLKTFAEEWESPEMDIYDDYDKAKSNI